MMVSIPGELEGSLNVDMANTLQKVITLTPTPPSSDENGGDEEAAVITLPIGLSCSNLHQLAQYFNLPLNLQQLEANEAATINEKLNLATYKSSIKSCEDALEWVKSELIKQVTETASDGITRGLVLVERPYGDEFSLPSDPDLRQSGMKVGFIGGRKEKLNVRLSSWMCDEKCRDHFKQVLENEGLLVNSSYREVIFGEGRGQFGYREAPTATRWVAVVEMKTLEESPGAKKRKVGE